MTRMLTIKRCQVKCLLCFFSETDGMEEFSAMSVRINSATEKMYILLILILQKGTLQSQS